MHFDTVKIGNHGLQTTNEGINQRNLKFSANVADKICFSCTKKICAWELIFGRAVSEDDFLTGLP